MLVPEVNEEEDKNEPACDIQLTDHSLHSFGNWRRFHGKESSPLEAIRELG